MNLGGKCVSISLEDKGTIYDYVELESKIFLKTEENRRMMEKNIIYAKESLPTGCELGKTAAKKLIRR